MICALMVGLCAGSVFGKTVAFRVQTPTPEPVKFGLGDLKDALKSVGLVPDPAQFGMKADVTINTGIYTESASSPSHKILSALKVTVPAKAESFAIARKGAEMTIVGRDAVGTMYGLLEMAERVKLEGEAALAVPKPIVQSPSVPFRAINPFLTLPLSENEDWWFLSEDFWRGYLDQLARSRVNWVDMHGMYDMKTTGFPNIYPYIVKSESFPDAGVAKDKADRNLAMLNRVLGWAKDRGVKFALMSYSTSWNVPYAPKAPYQENEANLTQYTREVVRNTIKSCPDLAMIGFRVGESGMGEDFFRKSYIQAVTESGRSIPIYTRSWGAKKAKCMEIGEQFPGQLIVEIKYNGEQLGAPYHLQGGRMAGWNDYSYQDFLSYPKNYDVIWQIRANGTHRVFTWASPDLIARAAETCTLAGSIGFCVEPSNAYYPMQGYFHKDDNDHPWFKWGYQRDWFWYTLWGRTAYNPAVPDKTWIGHFKKRFGAKAGEPVYRLVCKMSKIVPLAYTFYSLGPDHRNHAPELETGGTLEDWANGEPFDTQNVQSAREYVRRTLNNDPSARMTPPQAADLLEKTAEETMNILTEAKLSAAPDNNEFKCLTLDATALSYLARYYAAKLRGAVHLAALEQSGDIRMAESARSQAAIAGEMWRRLAETTEKHYKPFMEHLRMGDAYHWSREIPLLAKDEEAVNRAVDKLRANPITTVEFPARSGDDRAGPVVAPKSAELREIDVTTKELTISATAEDPAGVKSVFLKHKAFPSEKHWELTPMVLKDGKYTASMKVKSTGALYCFEALDNLGNGTTYPDFLTQTPYIVVAPWNAPGPPETKAGVTLDEIASLAGSASKYAAMVVGRDAMTIQSASPTVKKAILDLVSAGLSLVIYEQDHPAYDLSWLPGGIAGTDEDFDSCRLLQPHPLLADMGDSLSSQKVVNDALEGGDAEWKFLTEPKAIAIRKHGKGYIILVQIRTLNGVGQGADMLAQNIVNYVQAGDKKKPLLVIDEGNDSVVPMLKSLYAPIAVMGK
ncbi:MAG: hypothetical protein Q7T82_09105 [Armatimonadota bacterium]|nr:hypothetical protein [Armatimonadota bacterium]